MGTPLPLISMTRMLVTICAFGLRESTSSASTMKMMPTRHPHEEDAQDPVDHLVARVARLEVVDDALARLERHAQHRGQAPPARHLRPARPAHRRLPLGHHRLIGRRAVALLRRRAVALLRLPAAARSPAAGCLRRAVALLRLSLRRPVALLWLPVAAGRSPLPGGGP